jgi:hypothetical protein
MRRYEFSPDVSAPLEIRTAPGVNYLAKLVDPISQKTKLTFFIRGGQTLETSVPVGLFQLKYATGTSWCGEKSLFGSDTQFHKANAVLEFSRRETADGFTLVGHTVELIMQKNGNLKSTPINREDF